MEKVKAIGSPASWANIARTPATPDEYHFQIHANNVSSPTDKRYEMNFGFENLQNSLYYCCFDIENFTKPTQTDSSTWMSSDVVKAPRDKHRAAQHSPVSQELPRSLRIAFEFCQGLSISQLKSGSIAANAARCSMFRSPTHTTAANDELWNAANLSSWQACLHHSAAFVCCKLRWCLAIWELEWDLKIELEKVRDAVCWPTW